MFKTIEGAADCEIRSVIHFLNTRNVLPSEIHHHICQVYGDNAMGDGMVRKCVRMSNEGRENVHDEARSGRPSLVNDDLVLKVNERVRDDRRFTISDLSLHFPRISRTVGVVERLWISCCLVCGCSRYAYTKPYMCNTAQRHLILFYHILYFNVH